jgi:Na+/proline symporter
MAVMMSSAMTYQYGTSGLWWFTVPNGFAVIAIIPFARRLKETMPHGYTIGEFVSSRFNGAKLARIVMTAGLFFGALLAIIINLKGTSLVISTVFGVNQGTVAIITAVIVLLYTALGGLWASISTSTLTTLFITVPAAFVVTAVLSQVGGAEFVWQSVVDKGSELLSVTRPEAAVGFGITLALGLLTATIVGQDFWQVVWGLKGREVSRSFFWAGALFYPIPICLGILGLVGIALNVDLTTHLNGDAAAVGPFVVS